MADDIKKYIEELSDKDIRELVSIIVSSEDSAKNMFLSYCRKKFPEDGQKLKTDRVKVLFERAKYIFEYWDERDFGYFDYRLDDNTDINGNTFCNVVASIKDVFKDLYNGIKEDDFRIDDSLRSEIREFLFSNMYSWEGHLEETFIQISEVLCYTKEEELSLASTILEKNIWAGYETAYRLFEKNNAIQSLIELRVTRANSSQDAVSIINDCNRYGYQALAEEYALKIIKRESSYKIDNEDKNTDIICDLVYNSFIDKNDINGLFTLGNNKIPEHLASLILKKAEELDDVETCKNILSGYVYYGNIKDVRENYRKLKAIAPDKAAEIFSQYRSTTNERYVELCIEEKQFYKLFEMLDQYKESQKENRKKKISFSEMLAKSEYDSIARKLEDFEAKRIYDYYWEIAIISTQIMSSDYYSAATHYLCRARELSKKAGIIGWKKNFDDFMEQNKTKRSLMSMIHMHRILFE